MHSCAFVFFHHLKNNDAALEQRGHHSTTHRLNEERRGNQTSSFFSCRRDNETKKKKNQLPLSNYFSWAAVTAVLPALLKRNAAALWWLVITVPLFMPLLSFTGRRGSEALGRSNTKPGPGDEASLGAPPSQWQKISCLRSESFRKSAWLKCQLKSAKLQAKANRPHVLLAGDLRKFPELLCVIPRHQVAVKNTAASVSADNRPLLGKLLYC